ncbi:hypothetical protein WAK64_07570 [Bacillus spongiae]|uniref:Uncharacterized protein n=1 Tax=Bacillus spongiae TaxID=2683610 RepID=A0ABU8HC64_9BACI
MISLSIFVECQNKDEAIVISTELKKKIEPFIINYELQEIIPYRKIDGWFNMGINLETSNILEVESAERILETMSNKWDWTKGWSTALATERMDGLVFFNEKVKFIDCWFEDFALNETK